MKKLSFVCVLALLFLFPVVSVAEEEVLWCEAEQEEVKEPETPTRGPCSSSPNQPACCQEYAQDIYAQCMQDYIYVLIAGCLYDAENYCWAMCGMEQYCYVSCMMGRQAWCYNNVQVINPMEAQSACYPHFAEWYYQCMGS